MRRIINFTPVKISPADVLGRKGTMCENSQKHCLRSAKSQRQKITLE